MKRDIVKISAYRNIYSLVDEDNVSS